VKNILITGASGVIGSALLSELKGVKTICVGHRRRPPTQGRSTVIQGDISRPHLGLEDRVYRELVSRVDAIVHCAALTDFNGDAETMNRLNIAGTDIILELAAAAQAPLFHVSTAFVARRAGLDGATSGPERYLVSKREGERRVRASGLPAAIIRPSVVIGDSATGAISRFQGLHSLTGAVMRNALPIVPLREDDCIDCLPQDTVAAAIAGLVTRGEAGGDHWVTAGAQAPSVGRILDLCEEVAAEFGESPARPRLVASDVIDRLIRPVFIEPMPTIARERFDQMVEMTALFGGDEVFPSSMEKLGLELSSERLEDALKQSLRYWAESKGLGGMALRQARGA
jgi:nucleoside-diphosphate-sugar epimerase